MADDEIDTEDLSKTFQMATNFVRTIAGNLKNEDLLYFYARFKQANDGPCNTSRPGMFDFQGKQKWDAWKKLGDMSKNCAMSEYVDMLTMIDPDWEDKAGSTKSKSGMGVAVSTMQNMEGDIPDNQKTVFDWCREGNVTQLSKYFNSKNNVNINNLDENGLSLLHWSCDRGLADVVTFILDHGADINITDVDGQTPLHYAASCEHPDIVRLLLSRGADKNLTDAAGNTALQSADSLEIAAMLT